MLIGFLPDSEPIPETLLKVSFIVTTILPEVLSIPVWQSIYIKACVGIAIEKLFNSFPMLEAVLELSIINITWIISRLTICALMDALPWRESRPPASFIVLCIAPWQVKPVENAISMLLVVLVVTNVHISIRIYFISQPKPLVSCETSLINTAINIQRYAKALLLMLIRLAKVNPVLVLHKSDFGGFY